MKPDIEVQLREFSRSLEASLPDQDLDELIGTRVATRPVSRRLRRPWIAAVAGFILVAAVFVPAWLSFNSPASTYPAQPTDAEQQRSQSEADAQRDGVVPQLAELPLSIRASFQAQVTTEEGTWVLSRPTEELNELALENGCGFGDLSGAYPSEVICTFEYGEILLLDEHGQILRAYPMPGAPPSWIDVTASHVYAGRVGDGALPSSTLVRIDRSSLDAMVVVIQSPDSNPQWLSSWHVVASDDPLALQYKDLVQVGDEAEGSEVTSWIGRVVVDIDGVDQLIDIVLGG
jgi:hypothetical protein